MARWLKFQAVGGLGAGIQLAVLSLLTGPLHLHYLPATAAAVEAAVLHNFLWHQRFTWADRASGEPDRAWRRLIRFHIANGSISVAGNLAFMALLAGTLGMPPVAASGVAIAACAAVNFLVSDRLVFVAAGREGRRG